MEILKRNYLEDISIKPLLKKNEATSIDASECFRFNDFISNYYPWIAISKTRIDWAQITNKSRIRHDETSDRVINFLKNSFFHEYEEVCFVYSKSSPGVIISYNKMLQYFDHLIAPGFSQSVCFMVGVKRDKFDIPSLVVEDFMEVTLFDGWISYSLDRKKN